VLLTRCFPAGAALLLLGLAACAHREPVPFNTRLQQLNAQLADGRLTPPQYYSAVMRASQAERARLTREVRAGRGRPSSGSLIPVDAASTAADPAPEAYAQFRRDQAMRAALQQNAGRSPNFGTLDRPSATPPARLRSTPLPKPQEVPELPLPDGALDQ
jgi:hypothetical protein